MIEELKGYEFLIISSYKPTNLLKLSNKEILESIGLYDGNHFSQSVKCPECKKGMHVIFNVFNQPEKAQCMSCGTVKKIYYKIDNSIKWYKSDL